MSRRRERFASALRSVVANLVQTELTDPRLRGLLTVTRVEVSPDLRLAKVYVSVLGDGGEQKSSLAALRHGAGHLQGLLKKYLDFRICPILDFRLDQELKESLATMTLLDKVSSELAAKDAQAKKNTKGSNQAGENRSTVNEDQIEREYDHC